METIHVYGTPLFYIPVGSFLSFYVGGLNSSPIGEAASISSDSDGLDKKKACSILRGLKPDNCNLNNYQAAPGFPSAVGAPWAGNGCGSGGLSNVVASLAGWIRHPEAFSGNLDFPLDAYPSVSFTSMCNGHDACYATLGGAKKNCDTVFYRALDGYCDGLSTADASSICGMFASDYFQAVQDHGKGAYGAGQAQASCAQWATAMKLDQCSKAE